jgi:hypothetical protein
VGRRRLIPWSRLVRVNSEKPGNTLGVRFVDSFYNHRIAGTVSIVLWWGVYETVGRERGPGGSDGVMT